MLNFFPQIIQFSAGDAIFSLSAALSFYSIAHCRNFKCISYLIKEQLCKRIDHDAKLIACRVRRRTSKKNGESSVGLLESELSITNKLTRNGITRSSYNGEAHTRTSVNEVTKPIIAFP